MKSLLVVSACLVGAFCALGRYTTYNLGNLLDTYDADEPPEGVTTVRIGIYINQMSLTEEGTMKIMFYMRQAWLDPRLAGVGENVRLVGERYKQIWRPDTFFRNARNAGRRNNGMTVEQLTKINATGDVWHVMSIEGEFGCPQILAGRPKLTCYIMFESYGYTMDVLKYAWLDRPVDVDPDIRTKGYTLYDIDVHDCSQNYTAGMFPCHELQFRFRDDELTTDVSSEQVEDVASD